MYSVLNTLAQQLILVIISLYRAFGSLWLSGSCRFEPSCSVYAQEAIERYGVWVGGKLAIQRLIRCRPGGPFGIDPVDLNPVSHQKNVRLKECECLK